MLEKLIFLLEEPSMESALNNLLPQLANDIDCEIRQFQGKSDLLKQLPDRLRGYAQWLPSSWAIIVLIDRDDEDCLQLKQKLEHIATSSGLLTKTVASQGQAFQVANRVAIEELEAWFFGDWQAVQTAYPRVSTSIPNKATYRNPDGIKGGTWEALERELKRGGYFKTGLRKIEVAREISKYMNASQNISHSFQIFKEAIDAAKAWI